MKKTLLLISLMTFMLTPFISLAATINVPTIEQPTIQAGIDASTDGDTVLLADGTYTGAGNYNINSKGKSITVKSKGGFQKCIIDCQSLGRGFVIGGGSVTLYGLTVKNGNTENKGGGIWFWEGELTVVDCCFDSNTASKLGGAIFTSYYPGVPSKSSFQDCSFSNNNAANGGGGVYFQSGDLNTNLLSSFTNCDFNGNQKGVISSYGLEGNIDLSFTGCTFIHNQALNGNIINCSSINGGHTELSVIS